MACKDPSPIVLAATASLLGLLYLSGYPTQKGPDSVVRNDKEKRER